MSGVILDGVDLSCRRLPLLARRSEEVAERRGRPPAFLLVAFADEHGLTPHVDRKVRSCAQAGVEATPLIVPHGATTADALRRMTDAVTARAWDGLFLQFPYPAGIDGDALAASIPIDLDIDVMTPVRVARFMNGLDDLAPLTVSAGLLLLDAWEIPVSGLRGIVIAEPSPFALMFRGALRQRGVKVGPLVDPAADDLQDRVRAAELVVAAAGVPGIVSASVLSRGAVAIDVGYFNPDGHGDIDLTGGIAHLRAIAPVPGGIGPMTISALIERVIEFAEAEAAPEESSPS